MRFLSYTGEVPRGQERLATPEAMSHWLLEGWEAEMRWGFSGPRGPCREAVAMMQVSERTSVSSLALTPTCIKSHRQWSTPAHGY